MLSLVFAPPGGSALLARLTIGLGILLVILAQIPGAMQAVMLGFGQHHKIVGRVLLALLVVHVLIRQKATTKHLFCHQPMLKYITVLCRIGVLRRIHIHITSMLPAPTFPLGMKWSLLTIHMVARNVAQVIAHAIAPNRLAASGYWRRFSAPAQTQSRRVGRGDLLTQLLTHGAVFRRARPMPLHESLPLGYGRAAPALT